jgi:hypothetical protein
MLRADATNATSNGFSRKTRRHSATVGPSRLYIAAMAAAAETAVPAIRDDQSLSKGINCFIVAYTLKATVVLRQPLI